jgi:NHLM bacteriocin system ABC transporter ATP-binding protein
MTAQGQDALLAAARLVAAELDLELGPARPDQRATTGARERDPVDALTKASRVRARRVMLRGDWWRSNAGPLLAFREEDGLPVALLPQGPQRYALVVPGSARVPLTEALAERIKPGAYMFLPSFGDQPLTLVAMWRKGWHGTWPDLARLMTTSIAVGILALASPTLSKVLIDDVIPHGLSSKVPWIAGALTVFALMAAALGLVRGLSILRLESRMELNMEAALMDRVLRLPSRFFRNYDAGSLAERVLGITAIRQALAGTELVAILGGVFSFASLALIFFYDARLALLGLLLGAVALGAIVAGSLIALHHLRQIEVERGAMSGLLLQVLSGIAQLRVAGAEIRAFGVCAERFMRLHQLAYQAGLVETAFAVFRLAFPVLCTLLFFAAIHGINQASADAAKVLSAGAFFAVMSAFAQFLGGVLGLGAVVVSVIGVVPQFERLKPILDAALERRSSASDPGDLSGSIEVTHATFRYDETGPAILKDVSLSCRPGEMVALVGPSGSGKSTALRLLLGLETLESGTISYDGKDLAALDAEAVRGQVGVVLQGGRLAPGSLLSNILGPWNLSQDDAWEAARQVGLEDDIRAMPMGMHTAVGDAASTFSTGQQQRLMIARAIVRQPPILFLDEATSALDNRTQDVVATGLERLRMTRIVIAHRLSTIRHADRIYYLENGSVIEQGSYETLMRQDGRFAALARRQLLGSQA